MIKILFNKSKTVLVSHADRATNRQDFLYIMFKKMNTLMLKLILICIILQLLYSCKIIKMKTNRRPGVKSRIKTNSLNAL